MCSYIFANCYSADVSGWSQFPRALTPLTKMRESSSLVTSILSSCEEQWVHHVLAYSASFLFCFQSLSKLHCRAKIRFHMQEKNISFIISDDEHPEFGQKNSERKLFPLSLYKKSNFQQATTSVVFCTDRSFLHLRYKQYKHY